jgi:hypothetical protein
MVNRLRGEVEGVFNGKSYTLCLTLGALAELESAFGESDLTALGERFSSGRLSAKDILTLLKVGLRGGGSSVSDEEMSALQHEGGLTGALQLVASLLTATFGVPEKTPDNTIVSCPPPEPPIV